MINNVSSGSNYNNVNFGLNPKQVAKLGKRFPEVQAYIKHIEPEIKQFETENGVELGMEFYRNISGNHMVKVTAKKATSFFSNILNGNNPLFKKTMMAISESNKTGTDVEKQLHSGRVESFKTSLNEYLNIQA